MAQGSPTGPDPSAETTDPASPTDEATGATVAVDATQPGVAGADDRRSVRARLRDADLLDDLRDEDGEIRLSRREAMAYVAGTGAGLGGWKALHNVVLGYGILAGTNLLEQDLPALASERLGVRAGATAVGGYELRTDGDDVGVYAAGDRIDGVAIADGIAAAERIDAAYGLDAEPVAQLHADLGALADGSVSYEFSQTREFVDRVASADARPFTVDALRGPVYDSPEAGFVADFADAHPRDVAGLIGGLKDGFRQYSYYDVPRYVAGSIEDNVLLGAVDLRQYFESPTDFQALVDGENSGLFCTELVNRSVEAFHAVPATEQSPPIVAGCVYDERHKHSYTVLASAIREDGELVIPATFVDYTHSTLYDDLHLRWLLGEGLEAYNDRHRATEIFWNSYV